MPKFENVTALSWLTRDNSLKINNLLTLLAMAMQVEDGSLTMTAGWIWPVPFLIGLSVLQQSGSRSFFELVLTKHSAQ